MASEIHRAEMAGAIAAVYYDAPPMFIEVPVTVAEARQWLQDAIDNGCSAWMIDACRERIAKAEQGRMTRRISNPAREAWCDARFHGVAA